MSGGEPLSDELEAKIRASAVEIQSWYAAKAGWSERRTPNEVLHAFAREILTWEGGLIEAQASAIAIARAERDLYQAQWESVDKQLTDAREAARSLAKLLERISGWDHMDGAADGPYWRREIASLLRAYRESGRGKP